MSPKKAITAGTLNAAKSLAVDDRLGTIEIGKYADLIILGKDPVDDIKNIGTSLENIVLNGVFI
jgi:imidazolonepropionase-like amidohydrolase